MFRHPAIMHALIGGTLLLSTAFRQENVKPQGVPTMHHAHGTFTVKMGAPAPGPATGLSRFSMTKEIHGSIEGTSSGEMIAGGDYTTGMAGYVAAEVVTGTLDGKAGSFALQHSATMKGPAQQMNIVVTPGSGTGDLKGLEGTFTIIIKDGQHSYDMEYTLPEK